MHDSTYCEACVGNHAIFKYHRKFVNENLDYTSVLNILIQTLIFKDTHREKALSKGKTPALTKSTNMDIWVVGTTNQLLRGSLIETKFEKNKVVSGKTPFFLIVPFCTHHSICLNFFFFNMAVLYENDAFSDLFL